MKRIVLVTALIATIVVAGTLPAGAGTNVGPSAFKILKGYPRALLFTPSRWHRGAFTGPGAYRSA